MKWTYSIIAILSIVGCTGKLPPTKNTIPKEAEIVEIPPTIESEIPKRQVDEPVRKATLASIPVCEKSAMPGYSEGKALEAAIEGFNARGEDIDKCNQDIVKWAREYVGE